MSSNLQAAAADKPDKELAAAAKAEIDKLMALKAEVTAAETGCASIVLCTNRGFEPVWLLWPHACIDFRIYDVEATAGTAGLL